MKKLLTLCLFVLGWGLALRAQVAITQDGSQPDNSAMLDIKSTAKGLLIPRMSSAQRQAIVSPAVGLIVFDSDQKMFVYYNGTGWLPFSTGSNPWTVSAAGINPFSRQPTIYTDSAWVGIGTHIPQSALQIATPDFTFGLTHSSGTVRVGTFIGEGAGWVATATNSPLYFGTAEFLNNIDPQMVLTTAGTVGINNKTPNENYKLDVTGSINSTGNLDLSGTINAVVVNAKDSVKAVILHSDILNLKGSDNAINFQPSATAAGTWSIHEDGNGNLNFSYGDGKKTTTWFVMTPLGGLDGPRTPIAAIQSAQPTLGKVAQWRPAEDGGTLPGMSYREFSELAIKAIQMQQTAIKDQQAQIGSLTRRLEALEQKIAAVK
jgi:hypothetical protein